MSGSAEMETVEKHRDVAGELSRALVGERETGTSASPASRPSFLAPGAAGELVLNEE